MASPSATVLCTAAGSFRLAPNMVVLFFLAALLATPLATPTRSSSPSSNGAGLQQPTLTFCSGQSPAVTSSEVTRFLAAVCAGAYGVAHMSHNMSSYVVAQNRTMYGVAQCRPDVSVADCAACLTAASKLIIAGTRCAASAVWHDGCFLRYSDRDDPSRFREDEYTVTVFNASRALPLHGHEDGKAKAVVRRLLAAVANSTTSIHMCRSVGAGTAAEGLVYGLTRCAAGISCADCRRCLGGALAVVDREYNGSAGMQVLRLSCMARYESYPFYNTKSLPRRLLAEARYGRSGMGSDVIKLNGTASVSRPAATPAVPAPPGGRNPPPPSPPAQARAPPPAASRDVTANTTVFPGGRTGAAHPTPAPPGGHTPQPAAAAPNDQTVTGSSESKGKGMSNRSKWLIVSLATGLAIAAIILALTIWYRRKWRPAQRGHVIDGMPEETMHDQGNNKHLSKEEEEEDDGGRTSCQLYNYQVLEAATCCFSSRNKLGSGGFGTVYKGTLENGKEVAVKRLRDSKRTIQELEREISIVVNLRHMNLVRFLGYCFQEEGRFLIYEYVPNNSLDKFWYKASFQAEKLEWATWFNIILGVARGLQFLHDKGIIHRDLKPHNILLDDNFNPKIADFDLMRMYDKEKTHESTEKVAGTFGYMAPECTSGRKFLLSIKSDVYSYGVLVLEIITGHKIYTFEGQDSEGLVEYVWQHWTEKRGSDVVDGDLGVEGQEHAARQALRCVHVALLCVQSDRARRPTMGQVIAMLSSDDGAAQELPEPSLPGYVARPPAASGVQLCFGCR